MNHSYDTLMTALDQLKTALAHKESENQDLKLKVLEWKKRAMRQEAQFTIELDQWRERELQLLAEHQAHVEALTKAHVDKMDSLSENIICLQNVYEAQLATNNHEVPSPGPSIPTVANQKSQKATQLIGSMNGMLRDMTSKLEGCLQQQHENRYSYHSEVSSTPPLMSPEPVLYDDDDDRGMDSDDLVSDEEPAVNDDERPPRKAALYDQVPVAYSTPVLNIDVSPVPRLKSKRTMEHLNKVIPTFLKKKEQWKISHRRSTLLK
ncbi:hypothetical protein DM01DRAFT_1336852 [Hesseltinella vesiculosa]|uniref:Uncharacterized protein n=1 Tax=Hesseltinella vesiculosa TaxID=101127 RepID=A0A1X2GFH3_9FUNG|nr:hypothetical protein DM01DRAFT_1336852 [Hesseltinella vesiculosa]